MTLARRLRPLALALAATLAFAATSAQAGDSEDRFFHAIEVDYGDGVAVAEEAHASLGKVIGKKP